MRTVVALVALLLVAPAWGADRDPLAVAKALCDAGDFEKVLEAVGEAKGAGATEAAAVLARAGQIALDKGDRGMAALYCEMALAKAPADRRALEVCLRAAVADERWEDAGRFGDGLGKQAPKDGEVALLRAQAALAEGETNQARNLLAPHEKGPLAARVRPLMAQVEQRVAEARTEAAQQKDLEQKLAKAVAQARALDRAAAGKVEGSGSIASGEVVLYTTTWCGACKKAKAWLQQKGISFSERDVERDSGVTEELAAKCARAGVRPDGVPVLDARGRMLVGFDPKAYSEALR